MNILYVALNEYFPYPHAGSTHIYNICKNMKDLGNIVVILSRKKDVEQRKIDDMDVHYVHWNYAEMLFPIHALIKIIELCKEYNIDVIHERHSFPGGVGVLAGKIIGIPVVLEINSPLAEEFYPFPLYDIVQLNTKKQEYFADTIITQTPILKRILEKNTNTPIEVIPNGADPDFFKTKRTNLKKKLGIKGDIVTYVGTFTPWHGVEDLIKAFYDIDATLLLIGSGGNYEKCKNIANKRKNIIFIGSVPYEKLPEYLSISDIFVAPFSLKGKRGKALKKYGFWWSPVKIFEYMSMGKPVITTNLGVVPEYIKNSGLVYKEGSIEDLRNKIKLLLENKKLRNTLGKNGRKNIIKKYSWKIQAKKTLDVYKKLIRRHE